MQSFDSPTRLVLVRHGHTAGNEAGVDVHMSGRTDVPLSACGRAQAAMLAQWVARSVAPAALYTSPLRRSRDTAQQIASACSLPIAIHDGLAEIDCGQADGLLLSDVQRRFPAHWEANLRQDDEDFRWPGGESYRELRARCVAALDEIASAHRAQCVVVVTHAGPINQVLGWLLGVRACYWQPFRPGNATVTELEWVRGQGRLIRFDQDQHLGKEGDDGISTPKSVCAAKDAEPVARGGEGARIRQASGLR